MAGHNGFPYLSHEYGVIQTKKSAVEKKGKNYTRKWAPSSGTMRNVPIIKSVQTLTFNQKEIEYI